MHFSFRFYYSYYYYFHSVFSLSHEPARSRTSIHTPSTLHCPIMLLYCIISRIVVVRVPSFPIQYVMDPTARFSREISHKKARPWPRIKSNNIIIMYRCTRVFGSSKNEILWCSNRYETAAYDSCICVRARCQTKQRK